MEDYLGGACCLDSLEGVFDVVHPVEEAEREGRKGGREGGREGG